jgi:iron complex outermembrane receptor protein
MTLPVEGARRRRERHNLLLSNGSVVALTLLGFGLMTASAQAQDQEQNKQPPTGEVPTEPPAEAEPPSVEGDVDAPPLDAEPPLPLPEPGVGESQPAPVPAEPPGARPELPPTEVDPNEIVVTAQFRRQNAQKTPLSITAVSARMLEERSQVNIAEVANQAPNVRLSAGSGAFGPVLQAHIRGVGQNDFNYALEPGVGIYVDDVYFATLTGSLLDLLDLDRVEILRGPQGTLAGQNSIGGAIKLYSRVPEGDNTGFIQTTYGRFNRTELRAAGDFTVIKDVLFGRISGVANHRDGYVTRYDYACTHPGTMVPSFQDSETCKLGTEGGKSYGATRASLRWLPTDRIEVNVIGDYTNDNSQAEPNTLLYVGTADGPMGPGMPGVPNAPMMTMPSANTMIGGVPLGAATGSQFISYSPYGAFAQDTYSHSAYTNYSTYTDASPVNGSAPYSVPPVYRVNSGGVSAKAAFDLTDDLVLTSISAYRYYEGDWSVDEGTPVNTYLLHNTVWHRQFTEELRLNASILDGLIHVTVGGFYLNQESHYGGRIGLRTTQFLEDDAITGSSLAGFGNAEWHITRAFSLIAGARYSHQEKSFTYGRDLVPGAAANPMLTGLDGNVGKFAGNRVDYRAALQYQWLPELMTYVQFATGFKGGGVNPRPFVADQVRSHNPETVNAYEVGVKSDFFDKHMRVNLAGFFNQYKDIVMTVSMCPAPSTPAPCFMPINAGAANVMGGELEAVVTPVKGLGIDGSLSYLNFQYQSISAAGESSGIKVSMKGPYAPAWTASIGARYDFQFGSAGTLTPRLDLSYRDSLYTSPTNSPFGKLDSRTLLNGRLTWSSDDELWQAALEVTNITDLLYYYNIRDDRGSSFTVQGQPAPPRQWAVTLKRNFL